MSEYDLYDLVQKDAVEGVRDLGSGMGGSVSVVLGRAVPKDPHTNLHVDVVQSDAHRTRQQVKANILRPFLKLMMWHGMITSIDIEPELLKNKNERVRLSEYGKYVADRVFYRCSSSLLLGDTRYVTFVFDDKLKVCNQVLKLPHLHNFNALQIELDFSEITDEKLLFTLYKSLYSNGDNLRNFDVVYDDPERKNRMINKCSTRGFFKEMGWTLMRIVLIPLLFPIFLVSGVYIFFKYPKWNGTM